MIKGVFGAYEYYWILQNIMYMYNKVLDQPAVFYLKFLDRQLRINFVHLDQVPQNTASDQGLHGLPFIQQFLDSLASNKTDWIKFWDKFGKE